VFLPEYNNGAMENVGMVSMNEAMLKKGQSPTEDEMTRYQVTNLHELAHHWFGNLVTMKWWDDLWLNESFATIISEIAVSSLDRLTNDPEGVWLDFVIGQSEAV
jgi:aminopeptidase N